jgi:hypothetical protein
MVGHFWQCVIFQNTNDSTHDHNDTFQFHLDAKATINMIVVIPTNQNLFFTFIICWLVLFGCLQQMFGNVRGCHPVELLVPFGTKRFLWE